MKWSRTWAQAASSGAVGRVGGGRGTGGGVAWAARVVAGVAGSPVAPPSGAPSGAPLQAARAVPASPVALVARKPRRETWWRQPGSTGGREPRGGSGEPGPRGGGGGGGGGGERAGRAGMVAVGGFLLHYSSHLQGPLARRSRNWPAVATGGLLPQGGIPVQRYSMSSFSQEVSAVRAVAASGALAAASRNPARR